MKRYLLLLVVFLSGCAWWQAGINDPAIVSDAIHTAQPYKEIANAVFPNAGNAVLLALAPLLILLGGRKKVKSEEGISS